MAFLHTILISMIIICAAVAIFVIGTLAYNGVWLVRRNIGVTCPVCEGMGYWENRVCEACRGRRIIWDD